MRHQVLNNEMNREWVFFQGDAGIHGRPGFPGRKGEQVGIRGRKAGIIVC